MSHPSIREAKRVESEQGDVNTTDNRRKYWDRALSSEGRRWFDEDQKYFLHQSLSTPVLNVLSAARGAYIADLDGNQYLDMHGNGAEWCAGWYDEARGLRRANFGNWAAGKPDRFHLWAATGWPSHVGNGDVGFRLVGERRRPLRRRRVCSSRSDTRSRPRVGRARTGAGPVTSAGHCSGSAAVDAAAGGGPVASRRMRSIGAGSSSSSHSRQSPPRGRDADCARFFFGWPAAGACCARFSSLAMERR